jgi:hypothetical protein
LETSQIDFWSSLLEQLFLEKSQLLALKTKTTKNSSPLCMRSLLSIMIWWSMSRSRTDSRSAWLSALSATFISKITSLGISPSQMLEDALKLSALASMLCAFFALCLSPSFQASLRKSTNKWTSSTLRAKDQSATRPF